jgi:hypothetical protein
MKQLKVTRSHICGFSFMARRVKSVTNHAGVMRQNGNLKALAASCQYRAAKSPWPVTPHIVAGHFFCNS